MDIPGIETFEVLSELAKSRVRLGLASAYAAEAPLPVRIRTLPTRGVVTTRKLAAKELKLVPMSTAVLIYKADDEASSYLTAGAMFKHPLNHKVCKAAIVTPKLTLNDSTVLKEGTSKTIPKPGLFAPPYWFVNPTRDSAEANLVHAKIKITVESHEVSVPVLMNTRVVEEGAELFVYKPKAVEAEVAQLAWNSSIPKVRF